MRLRNFRAAILDVHHNSIPGAVVELGVWRGGAMVLAAAVLQELPLESRRQLHLFDAFAGVTSLCVVYSTVV